MIEKQILEDTLQIEEDRLVGLKEQKVLLNLVNKSTSHIDKEIKKCKTEIENIKNKIKGLK